MPTVKEVIEHNYQRATGRKLTGELMRDQEAEEPEVLSARAAAQALVARSAIRSPMDQLSDQYEKIANRFAGGDRSLAAFKELDSVAIAIMRSGNDFPAVAAFVNAGITSDQIIDSMIKRGVIQRAAPANMITVRVRPSPIRQLSALTGGQTQRYGLTVRSAVRRSLGLPS